LSVRIYQDGPPLRVYQYVSQVNVSVLDTSIVQISDRVHNIQEHTQSVPSGSTGTPRFGLLAGHEFHDQEREWFATSWFFLTKVTKHSG
jgi:hypothetical protein